MQPNRQAPKVILRHCDAYDPERIRVIAREGLEHLDLRPYGRTLLKPNIVCSGPMFEHAHTRPEFVEGVLRALQDRSDGKMTELAVGERCGITVPTRHAYEGAGFNPMLKRVGAKRYCFEEEPQVEIRYTHEKRLRDYVFTPEPVAKADFFVSCPKFKAHPWTTVTFAIKSYIGIQDDRHRLIDHDHRLNEKIADLQYIIQPEFIAIDAIIAGEGRMLTPLPVKLDLVIMGNNQVAFDAVCCAIIGVDPMTVDHIRLAYERGFGPISLDEIEISGDVTLEQARGRAKGFKVGLIRVEKYFEGTNITAYAGHPPESERTDYCWGGCPGAIEEAIEVLRLYDKDCDEKMPRTHVVFGAYEGPIPAGPGEKVVFIGDCAQWKGMLGDTPVQVDSVYQDRATKDPYTIKDEDLLKKVRRTASLIRKGKKQTHIRLGGCPVSVSEQLFMFIALGGLANPMNDLRAAKNYFLWKSAMAFKRIAGKKYQIPGEATRGGARPEGMHPIGVPAPATIAAPAAP